MHELPHQRYRQLAAAANELVTALNGIVVPDDGGDRVVAAVEHLDAVLVAQGQRETDDLVILEMSKKLAAVPDA